MPASITIALVASSPKVSGSRIEMPASGPMPGSTPTRVPTRQPMNAYHSTPGCNATEKPSSRLSKVASTSGLRSQNRSALERRLEGLAEQPPGDSGEPDAVSRGSAAVARSTTTSSTNTSSDIVMMKPSGW